MKVFNIFKKKKGKLPKELISYEEILIGNCKFKIISEEKKGLYIVSHIFHKSGVSRGIITSKKENYNYSTRVYTSLPEMKYVEMMCLEKDFESIKLNFKDIKGKSEEEIKQLAEKEVQKNSQLHLGILDESGKIVSVIEDSNY